MSQQSSSLEYPCWKKIQKRIPGKKGKKRCSKCKCFHECRPYDWIFFPTSGCQAKHGNGYNTYRNIHYGGDVIDECSGNRYKKIYCSCVSYEIEGATPDSYRWQTKMWHSLCLQTYLLIWRQNFTMSSLGSNGD